MKKSYLLPVAFVLALVWAALSVASCGVVVTSGTDLGSCRAGFATEPSASAGGGNVTLDSAVVEYAQSFVLDEELTPANVRLKLLASGVPTGTLVLKIEGDSGGAPDGITLATATLAASVACEAATGASACSTTAAFRAFSFSAASLPTLAAGRTYWLRLKAPAATNTNGITWLGNNEGAYASGLAKTSSDGTNWSSGALGTGRDFFFLIGC